MDALAMGIETIYQDLALAENLNTPANIFLGREKMKKALGFLNVLDHPYMQAESRKVLEKLDILIPSLRNRIRALSGGQRQAVAISRSIYWDAKFLIMDEPTAALGVAEQKKVIATINLLKSHGHRDHRHQPPDARRVPGRRPHGDHAPREKVAELITEADEPRRGGEPDRRGGDRSTRRAARMKLFSKTLLFFIGVIAFQSVLTILLITNVTRRANLADAQRELEDEATILYDGFNAWKRQIWISLIADRRTTRSSPRPVARDRGASLRELLLVTEGGRARR